MEDDTSLNNGDGDYLVPLLDGIDDLLVRRTDNLAEDRVFVVKVRGGYVSDKELTAIGVGTRICHCEDPRFVERPRILEFIRKGVWHLLSLEIEGLNIPVLRPTAAGTRGVPPLDHEVCDNPVEGYAFEKSILSKERK